MNSVVNLLGLDKNSKNFNVNQGKNDENYRPILL
jgi:hypothetical protein